MPEDQTDQEQAEQTPKGPAVPKRKESFGKRPQGPPPKPPVQSGMRGKGNRRPPPHHNTRSK